MVTIIPPYNGGGEANQSLLLLRITQFKDMVETLLKNFGPAGLPMIRAMGAECGKAEVKQLKEELTKLGSFPIKRELMERTFMRFSQMGWGKISLANFDPSRSVVVAEVRYNPFKSEKCPAIAGGCAFLHGVIDGVVSESLNEETKCMVPPCTCRGGVCRLEIVSVNVPRTEGIMNHPPTEHLSLKMPEGKQSGRIDPV